jgi:uncharacterized membrane protein
MLRWTPVGSDGDLARLTPSAVISPPAAASVMRPRTTPRDALVVRAHVYRALLAALAVLSASLYALDDWRRYQTFRSAGYDVGIFDQAIRRYASFEAPVSSLKGVGFSLLGDHFSPILAVVAPLFWIWPDTRMLGLLLGALVGASIFPVYSFSERRLGPGLALVTTTAYVFWWPIQGLVGFDFHEIAFAVPLVAWLIDSLDRGRRSTVVAICLVLLLVREDMGFMLLMVAIILAGRRQFRLAGALAIAGVVAFELITKIAIPAFSPDGTWRYWAYPALGGDAQSAIAHIGQHPIDTARLFVSVSAKRVLLVCLFLPPTLLALMSPYVLLAIPILIERLLSSRPFLWSFSYQYNAILAPILVLATVDTLARITRRETSAMRVIRMLVVCMLAFTVVGGTVAARNLYTLHDVFTAKGWAMTARMRADSGVIARIPPHVCVEADDRLIPHLIGRDYLVPPNGSEDIASWLAVDTSQKNTGGGAEVSPGARLAVAREQGFAEVWRSGPLRLLHRAGPANGLCGRVD